MFTCHIQCVSLVISWGQDTVLGLERTAGTGLDELSALWALVICRMLTVLFSDIAR